MRLAGSDCAPPSTPGARTMRTDIYVLGINYRPVGGNDIGHHPAAALLRNGEIVAMCEEERFIRIKEAPGLFPLQAIQFCLRRAGITMGDVSAIGWNWSPERAAERRDRQRSPLLRGFSSAARFGLRHTPLREFASGLSNGFLPERVVGDLRSQLLYWLGVEPDGRVLCFD